MIVVHGLRHYIAAHGSRRAEHDQDCDQSFVPETEKNGQGKKDERQYKKFDDCGGHRRSDFLQSLCAFKTCADTEQRHRRRRNGKLI